MNQARKSWALPGIYFKIFGKRRSIRILLSPFCEDGLLDPRSLFNNAIVPEAGANISSAPIRVSLTIAASEITPAIASQPARRASRLGKIA